MEGVRVVVGLVVASWVLAAAPIPDCPTVSCKNGSVTLDSYITDEQLKDCELAVYNKAGYLVGTVIKSKPLMVNFGSCPSEFYLKMRCPDLTELHFIVDREPSTLKNELPSSDNNRSPSFVLILLAVVVWCFLGMQ